jgi:hypothetical protein
MGRRSLLHVEVQAEGDGMYIGGHVTPLAEAVMTLSLSKENYVRCRAAR